MVRTLLECILVFDVFCQATSQNLKTYYFEISITLEITKYELFTRADWREGEHESDNSNWSSLLTILLYYSHLVKVRMPQIFASQFTFI